MPGYNKTGPMGQGRMTGRCFGICNRFPDAFPSAYNRAIGSGMDMKKRSSGPFCRQGFGMGPGGRFFGNQAPTSEPFSDDAALKMDLLKTEANSVKQILDEIYDQIKTLEKKKES